MQRGRDEADRPGNQVRKEPAHVPQEGALGLYAPKLLEDREGQDLRVREPLEGGVSPPVGVEPIVSVVDEAEEDGYRLFRSSEFLGKVSLSHPVLLWSGMGRVAPFLHHQTTQQTSSSAAEHTCE